MKTILTHTSRNENDILELLINTGGYTMCSLPHFRYKREKVICRELRKYGLIRKTGQTDTGINFVVTDFFTQWQKENPNLGAKQYWREYNPVIPKLKTCKTCNEQFKTLSPMQKWCSKQCRYNAKLTKKEQTND